MLRELTLTQKRHIFILLFFSPFLMGMAVDLYVPSLPAITQYFQVSTHLVQQTISFYMLGYAVGQIFLGVLSDRFGRKKIIVTCALSFSIMSFAAAFAPNIYFLIICRFLQGIAIAGPALSNRAMAADCFSGIDLHKAVSYYSTSWALGPIIGPFIGGYLQHYFGWQASFYFFAIYALMIYIHALFWVPETHWERMPLSLLKILSNIKSVLAHPIFLLNVLIGACIYGLLVIFNAIAPFLIQVNLNYSVIAYGHIALFLGFGYFIGNLLNRFLVHRIKSDKIALIGLIGAVLMSLILLILGLMCQQNLYILVMPTLILFIMCGLILPNNSAKSITLFPKMIGTATALFGALGIGAVFIFSSFAALLPTYNQIPLSLLYLSMTLLALLAFLISLRKMFK